MASNIEFKLEADLSKLLKFPERVREEVTKELYQFAETVMSASKDGPATVVVPVDTGTLRSTGHVDPPEQEPDQVSVTLGYGGPAASYALAVHENMDPGVHWKRPGSGPKYLEIPLRDHQEELSGLLAAAVNRAAK